MDLKIFTDNIENGALESIDKFIHLDAFKDSRVRIMPDVHSGKGCVIGFTASVKDKIIPNVVGVDIGCGMYCVELGKIDIDLEKVDAVIRQHVPHGQSVFSSKNDMEEGAMYWSKKYIDSLICAKHLTDTERLYRSMGTLGGGNHFIEIDKDDDGNAYLVIHSGSRNLGKQVCEYYQKLAIKNCDKSEEYKEKKRLVLDICKRSGNESLIATMLSALDRLYKEDALPDDLCYLEGTDMADYLYDMTKCKAWAMINREMIAKTIWKKTIWDGKYPYEYPKDFHTVHNYVSSYDYEDSNDREIIIRKGAVSAHKGEKILIPMNMRDGSLFCVGKGNADWNYSAPHGAGRIMSRSKAKATLNIQDYKSSMEGVFTTSINESTIDEAPMVYKPMDDIMSKIGDTVEVLKVIKPIYNFKSSN